MVYRVIIPLKKPLSKVKAAFIILNVSRLSVNRIRPRGLVPFEPGMAHLPKMVCEGMLPSLLCGQRRCIRELRVLAFVLLR